MIHGLALRQLAIGGRNAESIGVQHERHSWDGLRGPVCRSVRMNSIGLGGGGYFRDGFGNSSSIIEFARPVSITTVPAPCRNVGGGEDFRFRLRANA